MTFSSLHNALRGDDEQTFGTAPKMKQPQSGANRKNIIFKGNTQGLLSKLGIFTDSKILKNLFSKSININKKQHSLLAGFEFKRQAS
jgi:hypothetical protein